MRSLTSQRVRRTSDPENFQSSAKKDFFNTIGAKRTLAKAPMSPKYQRQLSTKSRRRPWAHRQPNSGGCISGGLESSAALGSPFTGKPRMKNQPPHAPHCAALFGTAF